MKPLLRKKQKGQVEFVAIIAIILIALVAIFLVLQQSIIPGPPPIGLTEEAKTVRNHIHGVIRSGVEGTLLTIYNQGGVRSPGSNSIEFGLSRVRIWQGCNEVSIPDIAKEIGDGLAYYLTKESGLKSEMELFGKKVTLDFSQLNIQVNIFKDNLKIKVNLPTRVEDFSITEPYDLSIQTKLYDVLEFSSNFANDVNKSKFFETVTIASMMHSNPASEYWLPVAGIQTGCGNSLFKTRADLLPAMEQVVKYTVSHVVWNKPPPRLADNPFYPINSVGGKVYPNLEVYFEYPSTWKLSQNFLSPNPVRVIPRPIMSLIPVCIAQYAIPYSVRYPVAVMVEDDLLNQFFKFAVMADIENNMPGNCTMGFEGVGEYTELCVNQARCDARITVKDTGGYAIDGVDVVFDICEIGRTDSAGVASGKIPCMVGELHAYKRGYKSFGDLFRSDELENKEITMTKVQENLTISFYGVPMDPGTKTGEGEYSGYTKTGSCQPVTQVKDVWVFSYFTPTTVDIFTMEDTELIATNMDEEGNFVDNVTVEGLYANQFNVSAIVNENETGYVIGAIDTTFTLGENDRVVYVYVPVVNVDESLNVTTESVKMTNTLKNAGINPVDTTAQSC